MDFTLIIVQIWGTFVWFIFAALFIGQLKSPCGSGHIGNVPSATIRSLATGQPNLPLPAQCHLDYAKRRRRSTTSSFALRYRIGLISMKAGDSWK